ncbi:unnamed protein product [Camellia sinensis]
MYNLLEERKKGEKKERKGKESEREKQRESLERTHFILLLVAGKEGISAQEEKKRD